MDKKVAVKKELRQIELVQSISGQVKVIRYQACDVAYVQCSAWGMYVKYKSHIYFREKFVKADFEKYLPVDADPVALFEIERRLYEKMT